jgi:hypothetical protein
MADKKISALTAASTPLAGTEVLPIVQSSTTVKVAVSDLTAGRTFSALGMTLTSTDAGATAAPIIDLYRDSATPAASDTLGEIEFNGEDSAGNKQAYGLIHASILSPTSTTEQGQLHFETATAGALTEKMIIGTTNLVINEIGAVFNVRIEGDTDANLFFTDATNSRVGVGTINPVSKLDVVGGDIRIDNGNLVIGTDGKGIDFSATPGTGTSELFDDYEEGTWTPSLEFGGASTGITYISGYQNGLYTKVGNIVTLTGVIYLSSKGSSTGTATISGIPFNGTNSDGTQSTASLRIDNTTFSGYPTLGAGKNATSLIFVQTSLLGTSTALTNTEFSDSSYAGFTITYRAA